VVRRGAPPSDQERYCAWFADARGGVLYFGEAPFWSAYRAWGGDPRADLRATGPQRIGRLDLATERLLPSLDVTEPGARSGVWDVLAHPNGRVYFTTFFGPPGWVDPSTGASERFRHLGSGLAELALASAGDLVAARYAQPGRRHGSVMRHSADGRLVWETVLDGPPERRVAPKSVAYDPVRHETWALTDLLSERGADAPAGHDTRVLDARGRERLRIASPEIQFVVFGDDGTGYLAEHEAGRLFLRVLPPGGAYGPEAGRRILLDDAFPGGFDFVQELSRAPDGRLVATRWSGWLHVVGPGDGVETLRLPRPDGEGLYYGTALRGERLCATYCSDLTVVCRPAPEPVTEP